MKRDYAAENKRKRDADRLEVWKQIISEAKKITEIGYGFIRFVPDHIREE